MVRILRVILVTALVSVLVMGLVTSLGCDGVAPNGVETNGDEPNGDEPNGDEPNGNEPNGFDSDEPENGQPENGQPENGQPENGQPENNEPEPDWTGLGSIIDCDEPSGQDLQVGEPAPDFRFQDAIGQTFSLSDFRGKTVMLNFWATWCGFCKVEFPYIQQVYDEWQDGEMVMLTVDLGEDSETVAACVEAEGISFPVLLDTGRKLEAPYGVSGMPLTFFIDKDGLIQFIRLGYFPSVEEIEDVLNQLV